MSTSRRSYPLEIKKSILKYLKEGMKNSEIASRLSLRKESLRTHINRNGGYDNYNFKEFTPQDFENLMTHRRANKIKKMLAAGKSYREIIRSLSFGKLYMLEIHIEKWGGRENYHYKVHKDFYNVNTEHSTIEKETPPQESEKVEELTKKIESLEKQILVLDEQIETITNFLKEKK